MKKISKKIIILVIILLMFMGINYVIMDTNHNVVLANESVEFENFDYEIEKIRLDGDLKINIILSWDTKEEIFINHIFITVPNQEEEVTNIKPESNLKNNNMYHYNLNFTVQNWQIGTMKIDIAYSNNLANTSEEHYIFYIAEGKYLEEEISWGNAIFLAIITTFCIAIGTFIIIENNKKSYLDNIN